MAETLVDAVDRPVRMSREEWARQEYQEVPRTGLNSDIKFLSDYEFGRFRDDVNGVRKILSRKEESRSYQILQTEIKYILKNLNIISTEGNRTAFNTPNGIGVVYKLGGNSFMAMIDIGAKPNYSIYKADPRADRKFKKYWGRSLFTRT